MFSFNTHYDESTPSTTNAVGGNQSTTTGATLKGVLIRWIGTNPQIANAVSNLLDNMLRKVCPYVAAAGAGVSQSCGTQESQSLGCFGLFSMFGSRAKSKGGGR